VKTTLKVTRRFLNWGRKKSSEKAPRLGQFKISRIRMLGLFFEGFGFKKAWFKNFLRKMDKPSVGKFLEPLQNDF